MTAALEGGEWSAPRPGRTLPQERPGTHFTGGWVGRTAGLDGRKIFVPTGIRSRTYMRIFLKSVEKIKVLLKPHKGNEYFT